MNWFNTGYLFKKQITLAHSQVSGSSDLTNYPALISMTDANLKTVANGGLVTNSSGFDLIFVDSTEATKLDHEIENYVSTTGEIEMWVRIPTLSHTADTTIYMYFNNASISTSQENKTGVWDSNYVGIWHLKESGNGTAGEFKDSTSNANNATGGNGTSGKTPTQTTGQIGKGQSFASASSQFIIKASPTGITTVQAVQTVAFWYKVTTNPSTETFLVAVEDSTDSLADQIEFTGSVLAITNSSGPGGILISTANPTANVWHHVAWTWDGTTHTFYVDGASKGTSTTAPNSATLANIAFGGGFDGTNTFANLNGLMDEVEWSKTARAGGWITTQYNNQNAPGTFATVGTLIRIPGSFIIYSSGGF